MFFHAKDLFVGAKLGWPAKPRHREPIFIAGDRLAVVAEFREALAQAGLIDKLFERFGQHLETEGYIARGGQIIDATIVSVPKQRNTKEENEAIKAGKTPEGWEQQPAKNAQRDKDARWTKKNDESFYGYKNHLVSTVRLLRLGIASRKAHHLVGAQHNRQLTRLTRIGDALRHRGVAESHAIKEP